VAYSPGAKAGTAGLMSATFPKRHLVIPAFRTKHMTSKPIATIETLMSGSAVLLETAGKQIVGY
jgi:hypothetical protein